MILHVRVKAGTRKEKAELKNGQWVISINAPAVEGRANTRLIEFLSETLDIPKSKIEIMKGHTSPYNTLEIRHPEDLVLQVLNNRS